MDAEEAVLAALLPLGVVLTILFFLCLGTRALQRSVRRALGGQVRSLLVITSPRKAANTIRQLGRMIFERGDKRKNIEETKGISFKPR